MYFVSVGSNSIVPHFDSQVCSQVAVSQSQVTKRITREKQNKVLLKYYMQHVNSETGILVFLGYFIIDTFLFKNDQDMTAI